MDSLSRVAALIRTATRLANRAGGTDPRSPWFDVVSECVTASGYLTDVPEPPEPSDDADTLTHSLGPTTLAALVHAAQILDQASGRRDHRAVMVRAALTDAIATARRNQP